MSEKQLQTTIMFGVVAMLSIVASGWAIHLVTPQKVAPAPPTLTV